MNVAFSTGRPAHASLPLQLLGQRGFNVTLYTAAYRSRFPSLAPEARLHWVPQLVPTFHFVTGIQLPRPLQRADTAFYDHLVALRIRRSSHARFSQTFDLFWGSATGALASARAARRLGARFILDRACPHVDVQQATVRSECERLGLRFSAEPAWFRDHQLAEYAEADRIVVPSHYSARSFPAELQNKIIVAPLFGRAPAPLSAAQPARPDLPFTFGTIGGSPVRKGFLDLLLAWEQLQLPHTRLLLRTDASLERFPALRTILQRVQNVELVGYRKDIGDFYRECDAFVLPTLDDGFGMVVLEAIAHGLPVITTPRCGAAELFRNHEDLLLVPPQNSESLAAAMEQIYRSADLRDRLRTQARATLATIESAGSYALYAQALDEMLQGLRL